MLLPLNKKVVIEECHSKQFPNVAYFMCISQFLLQQADKRWGQMLFLIRILVTYEVTPFF